MARQDSNNQITFWYHLLHPQSLPLRTLRMGINPLISHQHLRKVRTMHFDHWNCTMAFELLVFLHWMDLVNLVGMAHLQKTS